ncbi:MAG: TolC family protein [Holosporaceae bacterium]|nr:TolC family protein [Holosporaceae bacterium]
MVVLLPFLSLVVICGSVEGEPPPKANETMLNDIDGGSARKVKERDAKEARAQVELTFEEAWGAALRNNSGWLASQTDERSAEEASTQAKLSFLPNAQGQVSSQRSRAESVSAGTDIIGDTITERKTSKSTNTRMGITVSQNLFNGFASINRVKATSSNERAAHHKLKFEEQKLFIRVLDAYTSIWVGRQKVTALKKKEENLKKTADSKNSGMEAGVGTPAEVAQANANYQKAIYERIEAETELFTAESEFKKLTGLKADRSIELPNIEFQPPESLDKLIAQAITANHSIMAAKLEEQTEYHNLNVAKGALSPSCDLELGVSRSLTKEKYNNSSNNYSAALQVNVPIFANSPSSGNSYSTIAMANQRALKAKFTAEDTVQEVIKECIVQWNKYIAALAMIRASRSAVKSAELSTQSNFEENAIGTKSNTEIWVEENQLLDARVNLANSRKQRTQSAATIFVLAGNSDLRSLFKRKRY